MTFSLRKGILYGFIAGLTMKITTATKYIISTIILLWFMTANAVIVKDLYKVQIPVKDYSAQVKQQAILTSFKQILIKVSGNSNVVNLPEMQSVFANADAVVKTYSYIETNGTDDQQQIMLQISFDPKAIQEILTTAKQSIWGNDRPSVLLWLAISNDRGQTDLINSNDPLGPIVKNNSVRRGLPIVMPILDLSDMSRVSVNDIATTNLQTIKLASQRYNPSAILIGYINATDKNSFVSNWSLVVNNETLTWSLSGDTPQQIISQITDNVADALATIDVTTTQKPEANQLIMTIDNVNDLRTYVTVARYLQSLQIFTKVSLIDTTPTDIKVGLTTNVSLEKLKKVLDLDKKLEAVAQAEDSDVSKGNIELHYKWIAAAQ